ncbi:GNAT family N-acetyltransferase (plasmid) [Photobacterium sp. GJ3]|uniref:GNAT family N-acetyltransferase n=1 Tax=Photobacterium sp. GJ3 TaxID=2829502 RepID=UPI001B8AC6EE|nr:GNAT family protein [Photobacterium sp. GJ3]QUJ70071.1 GNAT family N-acetyltransferase [Photobacterium sp. GJ3]
MSQSPFLLQTPRFSLTDFRPSDTDDYVAMATDAKYQRFYSEADCEEEKMCALVALFIQQATERPRQAYQLAIRWPAAEGESEQFAGTAGLRIVRPGEASVGCGLARAFHGQAIADEAMSALIHYGFGTLGLNRIYAETLADNRAAMALCRRLGLEVSERIADHYHFKGRPWDAVILSVQREQWLNRAQIRE